jgi:hypothetical protein
LGQFADVPMATQAGCPQHCAHGRIHQLQGQGDGRVALVINVIEILGVGVQQLLNDIGGSSDNR